MKSFFMFLAKKIAPFFPDLKEKLILSGLGESSESFIERILSSSVYVSVALSILTALVLYILNINLLYTIVLFFFYVLFLFFYMLLYPIAKIEHRKREIDKELVFAGRHLLIALKSGMPFFNALVGVSSGYGKVSEEFRKIAEKVNMGVPLGQALRYASQYTPSNDFSRITIQLANAFSSGAEIADSLEVVLNQIAKEQAIALKEYGQKLNPLVMFFMIFGIIFPSLGSAFLVILFSLVSGGALGVNILSLVFILIGILITQFLFLTLIESSRPKYLL